MNTSLCVRDTTSEYFYVRDTTNEHLLLSQGHNQWTLPSVSGTQSVNTSMSGTQPMNTSFCVRDTMNTSLCVRDTTSEYFSLCHGHLQRTLLSVSMTQHRRPPPVSWIQICWYMHINQHMHASTKCTITLENKQLITINMCLMNWKLIWNIWERYNSCQFIKCSMSRSKANKCTLPNNLIEQGQQALH